MDGVFLLLSVKFSVSTPVMGLLSDHFNIRIQVTLFTGLLAVSALLMGWVSTVLNASLSFSLAGLGSAACWVPMVALVQKWVPAKNKGTALSVVTVGVGLGVSFWSMILALIVESYHWRSGWFCLGGFGIFVTALNWILVRNPPDPGEKFAADTKSTETNRRVYTRLLKDRTFWIIGVAYLFIGFNVLFPFTYMGVYIREGLGYPYAVSTRFIAIITLFGVVSQSTLGIWSDRVGRIRIMF
jgi:predicted MFS family arabinose efflux permease